MTQPSNANLVNYESTWEGVIRIVKRSRWYNKGYIPQHRIALALRSIVFGNSSKYVADVCKCMFQLSNETDIKKAIMKEICN